MTIANGAAVDHGGKTGGFWGGASGRWAGEQLMKVLAAGGQMSPAALRTLDTLRKDEWKELDDALVEEGVIRLRGVADLLAAGLNRTVPNGMGKTIFQWEKITDMEPAQVSLDGIVRTEGDRQEFSLENLPLPITHKDFFLNLRTLAASRERGESLDTTQARTAGRLVAEQTENLLFNGYDNTFGGFNIYGYTTHPDRNTSAFGAGGAWSGAAKTGEEILADLLTMIAGLEADRYYGPYWLYIPGNTSVKLEEDFKANSDKTIRQRLMEVSSLSAIRTADQLTADNIILVQGTSDVVTMVEGETTQTIQWDVEGGFQINFKAFNIHVPLVRSDAQGRSGVFHMS
jgi:uncharacterized linocin/CFP29 family protein